MKFQKLLTIVGLAHVAGLGLVDAEPKQPNILWVVTDDQRIDSISAFNKMSGDSGDSALGKVISPNVDRLAKEGTTFLNTYNQNPSCAPIRTVMQTGRYSHRTGVYGFEYYTPVEQAHWHPMVPQVMRDDAGYETIAVGKVGIRALDHTTGAKKAINMPLYQTHLGYRKEFFAGGKGDWDGSRSWSNGKQGPKVETFTFPDDEQLVWVEGNESASDDRDEIARRLDLFRGNRPGNDDGEILGGVNPQPGDKTRDGNFSEALLTHLSHVGESYTDLLGREQQGPDSGRPSFIYCGFEFPHTPVMPPAKFRKMFEGFHYEVPTVSQEELDGFPPQIKKLYKNSRSDHFTEAQKQQMISDYYAYCAYGDELVGQLVDAFVAYSEKEERPWLVLYVCGDHGWRLNEHGMVSKFSHYDTDLHNPIVVVSSDKKAFPAENVVTDFTTFLDMAPTFFAAAGLDTSAEKFRYLDGENLADVVRGDAPKREYIIAEPTHVIGPRALIRTEDYKFAMKVKPGNKPGKEMDWALSASLEDIEPTLFDLRIDPAEKVNLAFDPTYRPILDALREKLQNIVLGDGRVEVAWTREGGDTVYTGNFAPGADDGEIEVPARITE